MQTSTLYAALLILAAPAIAFAAEDKGVVRKIESSSSRVVVERNGKSQSFEVARDASIVRQDPGDKKKASKIRVLPEGLTGVEAGSSIEFLTEELDGRSMITSLKVVSGPKAEPAPKKKEEPKKKPPAAKKNPKKNKNASKKVAAKK